MRASRATTLAVVAVLLAAACDGGGEPTPTPTGLPEAREGRITRLMGTGSDEALREVRTLPDAPVSGPTFLTVAPDGSLIGSQWKRGLFRLTPDGLAQPLTDNDDDPWQVPVTVLAGEQNLLALVDENSQARLGTVSLSSGEFTEVATLTDQVENVPVSGLFELPDGIHVQWAGTWWRVGGTVDEPTGAERVSPPVEGIIASARTESGVTVLSATEMVVLDESLREVARSPWKFPDELAGHSVAAVTGDGGDGLYVATNIPGSSRTGGVIHVTGDGVDLLAAGKPPGDGAGELECEDADRPVMDAHLALVQSLVVWQDRLIVADEVCSSVLQLPLPGRPDRA